VNERFLTSVSPRDAGTFTPSSPRAWRGVPVEMSWLFSELREFGDRVFGCE